MNNLLVEAAIVEGHLEFLWGWQRQSLEAAAAIHTRSIGLSKRHMPQIACSGGQFVRHAHGGIQVQAHSVQIAGQRSSRQRQQQP
jgi:hypothetical protein